MIWIMINQDKPIDFGEKSPATIIEEERILNEITVPIIEITGTRKTLIFAASFLHAEDICGNLNRYRPGSARWMDGDTPKDERADMLREYANGDFQYLVKVGATLENLDELGVEIMVMGIPAMGRKSLWDGSE